MAFSTWNWVHKTLALSTAHRSALDRSGVADPHACYGLRVCNPFGVTTGPSGISLVCKLGVEEGFPIARCLAELGMSVSGRSDALLHEA